MLREYRVTPVEYLGNPWASRPSYPTAKTEQTIDLPKDLDSGHEPAICKAAVDAAIQCVTIQPVRVSVEPASGDVRALDPLVPIELTNHRHLATANGTVAVKKYLDVLLIRHGQVQRYCSITYC